MGGDGSVWGLDSSNHVYRYLPQSSSPAVNSIATLPNVIKQISVGVDGTAWALDANELIYFFQRGARTWQNVPGNLARISVGSSENVWGVDAGAGIWAWQQNYPPSRISMPAELTQVAAAADGSVFGINTYGQTYTANAFSPPGTNRAIAWTNIPGTLSQLSVDAVGTAWGINYLGHTYS